MAQCALDYSRRQDPARDVEALVSFVGSWDILYIYIDWLLRHRTFLIGWTDPFIAAQMPLCHGVFFSVLPAVRAPGVLLLGGRGLLNPVSRIRVSCGTIAGDSPD